jgi:S1-C subfamily serine protease
MRSVVANCSRLTGSVEKFSAALALTGIVVLSAGCQVGPVTIHASVPQSTRATLTDWSRNIKSIEVTEADISFYSGRGGIIAVKPTLSKYYADEMEDSIAQVITSSGGRVGSNGPDLIIDIDDLSLTWDFSWLGESTAVSRLTGTIVCPDGERIVVTGKADSFVSSPSSQAIYRRTQDQVSLVLAKSIERMLETETDYGEKTNTANTTKSGTGFAVSPNGLIVTAYHVVSDAKVVDVIINGINARASVIATLPKNDLAALKVEVPTPNYFNLVYTHGPRIGTSVYTLGYPLAGILTEDIRFNEGTISAISGLEDGDGLIQISIPLQPGNSGGPLLTTNGELAGVVVGKAADLAILNASGALPENIGFATEAHHLTALLNTVGWQQTVSTDETLSVSDASNCVFQIKAK